MMRLFGVVAIAVATTAVSWDCAAQGPCEQLRAACAAAGFVRGGAASGKGLVADCLEPIIQGRPARRADRPLPQVGPQLIAECRAESSAFAAQRTPAAGIPESEDRVDSAGPGAATPHPAPPAPVAPGGVRPRGPNIVFILTDDLSWNLVPFMPHVRQMQKDGATFANYFVTDSLCCPSRSSIFTGRYPHNTGVYRNTGKDGGYLAFRGRGHEGETFATALSAAGYRTAMLGKYLNGYQPAMHPPALGWTTWAVAGNGYPEFRYALNEDGRVVRYGDSPADYLTDVLSGIAARFIKSAVGTPFAIEIATFAPHAPYTPAPRDANAFPGLAAPRTSAFDAVPEAEAPQWLRAHPALTAADIATIDRDFRKRAQSVLAVDRMIGELQAAVAAIGATENTYFVFSSDNGYHMGEHRLMPGKMTAFDTDIRVPLIVTGPGVPAGLTIGEVAENVDLCPTFTELGGARAPGHVDGRSLVALLHGATTADWRAAALVEHHGPHNDPADPDAPARRSGNPTTYEALRSAKSVYVEYAGGEREYHDLVADPQELHNGFAALPNGEKSALHALLQAMQGCRDAKSCADADSARTNSLRK